MRSLKITRFEELYHKKRSLPVVYLLFSRSQIPLVVGDAMYELQWWWATNAHFWIKNTWQTTKNYKDIHWKNLRLKLNPTQPCLLKTVVKMTTHKKRRVWLIISWMLSVFLGPVFDAIENIFGCLRPAKTPSCHSITYKSKGKTSLGFAKISPTWIKNHTENKYENKIKT